MSPDGAAWTEVAFPAPAFDVVRLTRRIPLGDRARLEIIGEALLNSTNITSQRDTLYNNFTGTALVPQQNLANPRLNFGADAGTQVNFEAIQRIVQVAARVTF